MEQSLYKKPSFIVVGLALFSMFFGSGNLIFPLMLGRDAGSSFLISASGFILTAVLIPCLGVIAVAFAKGDYDEIFAKFIGGKLKNLLIFIVLLSFVPFGAGPRCVILAHASLKVFLPMPSLWIFAVLFLLLVAFLVNDRKHLIDILGKILTPLLLICIAVMVISALMHGEIDPPLMSNKELFKNAVFEGYNTQDLLSSIFFSSSLIILMQPSFNNTKEMTLTLLKGAMVGIILLTIMYIALISAASLHNDILLGKSGIDLVSLLAKHTMGPYLGIVASLAVALACLTTAVALVMAFVDFLNTHFLKQKHGRLSLPITIVAVFFTTLLEFDGIMAIIGPMMKIVYPFIMLVVTYYLLSKYLSHHRSRKALT